MNRDLLACLVVFQMLLYAVYAVFAGRIDLTKLWGAIPRHMHTPGTALAAIGYLMLLVALFSLSLGPLMSNVREWTLVSAVMMFFVLQILYVPFASLAVSGDVDKNIVRGILLACVIPVAIVAGVAAKTEDKLATVCASVALLHFTAFDAVYYGFFF